MADIAVNASLLTAHYARAATVSSETARASRSLGHSDGDDRSKGNAHESELADRRSLPVDRVDVAGAVSSSSAGEFEPAKLQSEEAASAGEEPAPGVGRREQPIPARNIPLGSTVDLTV